MSNLGSFGHYVKRYADLTGFVPQLGDKREDFNYTPDAIRLWEDDELVPVSWDEWVEAAVQATGDAENDAQVWREGN
jgi:hypothetical protein